VIQAKKLEEWRDALTGGEDREVTFTILLTKRCGFACAHCMFAAGPRGEARWMPAGVLDEVLLAATTFRDWGFRTRLNLLGGEPTLDLERFALIHSHISHHPLSHDLEMEMTTNGWWLRSWKDTCRFAGIVGEAVAREELAIRISNSTWHDPFRKGEKHIINRRALQEALENPTSGSTCLSPCVNAAEHWLTRKAAAAVKRVARACPRRNTTRPRTRA
jgi:hypothetical protein